MPFASQNVKFTIIIVSSFLLFVFLSTVPCALYPTFAAESTPSADIKTKLEELKKEIASKAAKLKIEVDRKLKDKAYVGKVKSFSGASITLAADPNPKMVSINQDTVFETNIKSKSKFSSKTMAEDDYIAALGDADETGVLIAKKVILLPAPLDKQKTNLWGKIISISDRLLTLKDKDFKNVAVSLSKAVNLKLNDFVILTGAQDKNEIFSAGFAYIIPQGGILRPKKLATPSAKLATPSAKQATKSASPKPVSR